MWIKMTLKFQIPFAWDLFFIRFPSLRMGFINYSNKKVQCLVERNNYQNIYSYRFFIHLEWFFALQNVSNFSYANFYVFSVFLFLTHLKKLFIRVYHYLLNQQNLQCNFFWGLVPFFLFSLQFFSILIFWKKNLQLQNPFFFRVESVKKRINLWSALYMQRYSAG